MRGDKRLTAGREKELATPDHRMADHHMLCKPCFKLGWNIRIQVLGHISIKHLCGSGRISH